MQLPSSFLTAMATALLPAISQAAAKGHGPRLKKAVSESLLFTCVASYGAAAIFVLFASDICQLVYEDASLGSFLLPLGLLAPFCYLHITLNGICNGLNQQTFSFLIHTLSSLLSIVCLFWGLPKLGILAYFLTTAISLFFSCGCFFIRFSHMGLLQIDLRRFFVLPCLGLLLATLVERLLPVLPLGSNLDTVFHCGFFLLVYGLCLLFSGVLDACLPFMLRRKK